MKFFIPGFQPILLFLMAAFLASEHSFAQTAGPLRIPTALICGPFSGNPPRTPAFADKFTLDFSNGIFSGVRPAKVRKGSETFKGSIDPSGKIKISGVGHYDDRSSEWTSEFIGQVQEKAPTILQGTVRVKGLAAGVNKCSIGFLLPAADLKKAFSPSEPAAQPRPQ
jgi:hypothetical protein